METDVKTVLSASRRTDIPAFYMEWFMAGIDRGLFEVTNPYNGVVRQVECTPESVHTIVFWSKNFGPFLDGRFGETLAGEGYHLFFNFTVNTEDRLLEPNLPPLDQRLCQLDALARRFGPERVQWRFDPICFYSAGNGGFKNNLADFPKIAKAATEAGIGRCVTSFLDLYAKVKKRAARAGVTFMEPGMEKQVEIVTRMADLLKGCGIALHTCCEKELMAGLAGNVPVTASACINGRLFMENDGGVVPVQKDRGQRAGAGCGCTESIDIGSYAQHPCYHSCLFCYANPAAVTSRHSGLRAGIQKK
ncbi:DUF1848 domain-containing protein [Desulfosudis oleivorans]|nr:DUF1848 domain-containing protein [Desulfosudis oleivorans]